MDAISQGTVEGFMEFGEFIGLLMFFLLSRHVTERVNSRVHFAPWILVLTISGLVAFGYGEKKASEKDRDKDGGYSLTQVDQDEMDRAEVRARTEAFVLLVGVGVAGIFSYKPTKLKAEGLILPSNYS
jgi:hypothetical protein